MGYFVFKKVEPKHGVMSDIHNTVLGKRCVVDVVNVGECAWLKYVPFDDEPMYYHQMRTSPVLQYKKADDGSWIKIETKNTNYLLEYVAE